MVPGVDDGKEVVGPRRPEERGGPDVSQQLGRVPRPLEVRLSPEERATYQPEQECSSRLTTRQRVGLDRIDRAGDTMRSVLLAPL
jgi:hypothetical protein